MKLYDQITVEGLFEQGSELLSEKLNKYSLNGWHFVALIPNKANPALNLIVLEKEVGYDTFLETTRLVSKQSDLYHKPEAHICIANGKEMSIECIDRIGRVGVCFDTEGTSSWFVVRNDGFSDSGTFENTQKLIDAVLKYKSKIK